MEGKWIKVETEACDETKFHELWWMKYICQ